MPYVQHTVTFATSACPAWLEGPVAVLLASHDAPPPPRQGKVEEEKPPAAEEKARDTEYRETQISAPRDGGDKEASTSTSTAAKPTGSPSSFSSSSSSEEKKKTLGLLLGLDPALRHHGRRLLAWANQVLSDPHLPRLTHLPVAITPPRPSQSTADPGGTTTWTFRRTSPDISTTKFPPTPHRNRNDDHHYQHQHQHQHQHQQQHQQEQQYHRLDYVDPPPGRGGEIPPRRPRVTYQWPWRSYPT